MGIWRRVRLSVLVLPSRISQAARSGHGLLSWLGHYQARKFFLILVRSPQSMLGKVWWNNWCQLLYWAVRNLVYCFRRGPGCCVVTLLINIIGNIGGGGWDNYIKSNHPLGNSASSHSLITDNEHFSRGLCMGYDGFSAHCNYCNQSGL